MLGVSMPSCADTGTLQARSQDPAVTTARATSKMFRDFRISDVNSLARFRDPSQTLAESAATSGSTDT